MKLEGRSIEIIQTEIVLSYLQSLEKPPSSPIGECTQ